MAAEIKHTNKGQLIGVGENTRKKAGVGGGLK